MASRLKISSSETVVVMYVDMVDSTKITCELGDSDKLRQFYETYINTLSDIAIARSARILKTGGDSVILYFPKTKDCLEASGFKDMLNCGLDIIQAHVILDEKLESAGLPLARYRVSADIGKHEVVKDQNLEIVDIFGPTMCICSKINALAPPNSMVIGSDLNEIVKSYADFKILSHGQYSIQKKPYPVYRVIRNL